ncbi:MAG: hypothetical protein ACON5N_00085 [Akkermansiaceae bacterium]
MTVILRVAGIYNILYALWIFGWPTAWFDLVGMNVPEPLFIWQGVGMLIGVWGVGYLAASMAPIRHWPIVLVGFLAKLFAACGFVYFASMGEVPWSVGWSVLINDVLWLPPFAVILWGAVCMMVGRPVVGEPMKLDEAMETYRLSSGETLGEASEKGLVAVAFLRHFGCTFTRQLLRNLEEMHEQTKREGARLVLVHMLQEGDEVEFVRDDGVERIADPKCELYRAFGLGKGSFLELFGLRVWYRGAIAFFRGCGVGMIKGDGLQMPGAFLVRDRKIEKARRAATAADLPDVEELFAAS